MSKADILANSIDNVAKQQTERKEPKSNGAKPVEQKPVDNSGQHKVEFFTGGEKKNEAPTEQTPVQLLTEDVLTATGKTGAYLTESIHDTIFGLTERVIYITRFTAEEKARLVIIDSLPASKLTPDDENLNRKFLAITKKHDKIREKMELDEKDKESLEYAFKEHARITGKPLNPSLILTSTLVKIICNRAIDIFL